MTDTETNGHGPDPTWWSTDDSEPASGAAPPDELLRQLPPRPAPQRTQPVPDTDASEPVGRPKSQRAPAKVVDRWKAQQGRFRWVPIAAAVLLVTFLVVTFLNRSADRVGKSMGGPLERHAEALEKAVGQAIQANTQPSQLTVATPLSWLACPITPDAGTMIGYDPSTQFATLVPGRAAKVDTQVRALVMTTPVGALRLTAPDATTLTVVNGGTQGVLLVDCATASGNTANTVPNQGTVPAQPKKSGD